MKHLQHTSSASTIILGVILLLVNNVQQHGTIIPQAHAQTTSTSQPTTTTQPSKNPTPSPTTSPTISDSPSFTPTSSFQPTSSSIPTSSSAPTDRMQFETVNATTLVSNLISTESEYQIEINNVVASSHIESCAALFTRGHTLGYLYQKDPITNDLITDTNGSF